MIAQLGRALGKGDSAAARVQLRAVIASIGSRSSQLPPTAAPFAAKLYWWPPRTHQKLTNTYPTVIATRTG